MKKSGNEKSCNSFCFLNFQLWLTTLANSEKIRTRFDRNIWISFLVQQPLPAMPFEPSVIRSLHSHFASGTTWSSTRRTWRKAWARLTLQPFAIPSWVNPGCMPRSSVTLAHSTLPALDGQFTTSGAILHKAWCTFKQWQIIDKFELLIKANGHSSVDHAKLWSFDPSQS